MRRLKRWAAPAAVVVLIGCGGGGEGTERPGDCTDDEYYDEGSEECRSCPAVVEPECRPGCDVVQVQDDRECPVLECDEDCEE